MIIQELKKELLKILKKYIKREIKTQLNEIKKKYKCELYQMSFI